MQYDQIRRKTRAVRVGRVGIGGHAPIAVQSMTNVDPRDARATLAQIRALAEAGCDIVRVTVPDLDAAETVRLVKESGEETPIVADIHYDYRIAIRCAEYGVDKIRLNPGNIGDDDRVRAVAEACRSRGIPIRIGVNSGSVERGILERHGAPTPEALCESALYHASLLERVGFEDIVISVKASTVIGTIGAYRLIARSCPYPLHLGVTEAGQGEEGLVKSAIGIGSLLCDGIGDTFRVSLTDDPVREVQAARQILNAIDAEGQRGLQIVSCPTCGRTGIDLIGLVARFKAAVRAEGLDRLPLRVALMGCAVNGPGEARQCDFGVAGGRGEAVLFEKGEVVSKIPEEAVIPTLLGRLRRFRDGGDAQA